MPIDPTPIILPLTSGEAAGLIPAVDYGEISIVLALAALAILLVIMFLTDSQKGIR